MQKIFFIHALLLTASVTLPNLFSAENLNGKMWQKTLRSKTASVVPQINSVVLKDDAIYFMMLPQAKAGMTVEVSVKSSGSGKGIAYLESFGEKPARIASSAKPFTVDKNANETNFSLEIPEKWHFPVRIYLRSTPGSQVEYSNLTIKVRKTQLADRLKRINLQDTSIWTKALRSPGAAIQNVNGKATLKEDAIYSTTLPPVIPGMRYDISVKISGKGQAMAYVESFYNKELRISSPTTRYTAAGETVTFSLDVPEKWDAPLRLFLRSLRGSAITFSDLSITMSPGISQSPEIANIDLNPDMWQKKELAGNARIIADKNSATLENEAVYTRKLPRIPGGTLCTMELTATGKGDFQAYIQSVDNSKVIHSGDRIFSTADGDVKLKLTMTVPDNWNKELYIVLKTLPGAKVKFSDPRVFAERSVAVIHQQKIWSLAGGSRLTAFPDHTPGIAVLLESLENQFCASLPGFYLAPGKLYEITYLVQGVGNDTDSTGFHHYQPQLFAPGGQKLLIAGKADDTRPEKAVTRTFQFRAPDNFRGNAVLAFKVTGQSRIAVKVTGFREVAPKPEENFRFALTSPDMTGFIFASCPVSGISGKVIAPEADSCNLSCGGKLIPVNRTNDGFEFNIPLEKLGDGDKFLLKAELKDKNNRILRTLEKEIRKLPAHPMEVVIDRDRFFRINGKRFMPIFSSRLPVEKSQHLETLLKTLQAAGFNTISLQSFHNEKDNLELLDTLHKYGIHAILKLPQPHSEDTFGKFTEVVKNTITPKVICHPALFAWGYVDEPAWNGASQSLLVKGYKLFKELDPYHPVWMNAAPPSDTETLRFFAQAADIYGVDIYPVPKAQTSVIKDSTLAIIGKQSRYTNEAMDHVKPVWMFLQAFAWGDINPHPAKPSVYPTYGELRYMAFDSMLNDSKGLGWYSLAYTPFESNEKYRNFLAALWQVNREIAALTDIFMAEGITTLQPDGITVKRWQFPEGKVVIAINTTGKALKFEDVTLAPYEVKIQTSGKTPALRELPPPPGNMDEFFITLADNKGYPYKGRANWIWAQEKYGKFFSTGVLAKVINIDSDIRHAEIMCCADDAGALWLNGEKLGDFSGWSRLKRFDLTGKLKKGQNLLLLSVKDGTHPPHAAMAELTITGKNGEVQTIVTDSSWTGTAEFDEAKATVREVKKWRPVILITPYGGGPWRENVKMPVK